MQKSFEWSVNGGVVRGFVHQPDRADCPCLVLCHGLTGNCHERLLVSIARRLCEAGIACVRFDCRGSGESDGESRDARVQTEVEDMRAAVRYARSLPGIRGDAVWLGGHSLGALVAILTARQEPPAGLVLLSSALTCYHELIAPLTGTRLASFRDGGTEDFGGFEIARGMVEELTELDGYAEAAAVQAPFLLIHGELDGDSPVYNSIRLRQLLGDRAELHLIPDVHHCYETHAAQTAVGTIIADYLSAKTR